MSAEIAVQVAIRARLMASPAVLALVPASGILNMSQRPAPSSSIIRGESQAIDTGGDIARRQTHVIHSLHVWKKEPSLEGVKRICGAIRDAVHADRLMLWPDFHEADAKVSTMRQMRDPDGETLHGVVTDEVLVRDNRMRSG